MLCYAFDKLSDLHTKRGELDKRQHVVSWRLSVNSYINAGCIIMVIIPLLLIIIIIIVVVIIRQLFVITTESDVSALCSHLIMFNILCSVLCSQSAAVIFIKCSDTSWARTCTNHDFIFMWYDIWPQPFRLRHTWGILCHE